MPVAARRHDVGRALITVEQRIGGAGIAWRQAARAITAADEQDAGQHQQDQQRRGDQLLAVRPARAVRAEPDAEQQQQRLHPAATGMNAALNMPTRQRPSSPL